MAHATQARSEQALLGEIIAERRIRTHFQPIVELQERRVVGYEALSRGPEGSELERPDLMFGAARDAGRVTELDRACRGASFAAAKAAGLRAPATLFVNVEPEALGRGGGEPAELPPQLPLTVEFTERDLTQRPAQLMQAVAAARAAGFAIALDDVGVDPRSLALMPFVRPDVVKLDMSLIQDAPSDAIALTHNAVSAYAEQTGAAVLAEGIETEAQARRARALGATLGQGWLFGRPEPIEPGSLPDFPARALTVPPAPEPAGASPFELVAAARPLRQGIKALLLEISLEIERRAAGLGPHAVVISTFQHARHFTPATARRYAGLAEGAALVGALGERMEAEPVPGVRGAHLASDDPLVAEWDIAVIGPHFAAAFVARELGDAGDDSQRRFDFALTHDRELAVAAARSLMARVAPASA